MDVSRSLTTILEATSESSSLRNPYLAQLIEQLTFSDITVEYWSLRSAFFGKFDIVHIHWADSIYRGRTHIRTIVKCFLFMAMIVRWKIARVKIVWTVHNILPHERLRIIERITEWFFRKSLTQVILLNDSDVGLESIIPGVPRVTILHGHYIDWFNNSEKFSPVVGRIVFAGMMRPYKGIESLVRSFSDTEDPRLTLVLAGQPLSDEYESVIRGMTADDLRIHTQFGFLSESDLVRSITESMLVVLPYHGLYNSGAAILALSLGRPILVPHTPSMKLLQTEVGLGWVNIFEGDLTAVSLDSALDGVATRGELPELEARNWQTIGRQHFELFTGLSAS